MQNNQVIKKFLTVSAVAAMFAAFGVQAQTSGQTAQSMTNQSATGKTNLTGKTAADGTVNNTSSQGMEDRSGQMGASGSQGTTRADGAKSHTAMQSTSGASGAAGATGSGAALSKTDKKAMMDMAIANMAEVETGKLALSKSQNAEVKTYAQQMIDDHGKALSELQTLAQQKGVTLPTELDAKHKAMAAKLEKLSGDAFDKEYMKQAGLNDHKATHAKLQKISKNAKDPDVKGAATKTLPVVEQHLKSAQQMTSAKSGTTSGK